jgi:hypothetical protein
MPKADGQPHVGQIVRYQGGPTEIAGDSYAALIVQIGRTTIKAFESSGIPIPDGARVFNADGGDWIEVCTLAVFFPREMRYLSFIPHSNTASAQTWSWPEDVDP